MAGPGEAHGGLLGIRPVTVAIYCGAVFTAARYSEILDAWYCIECGKQVKVVW
jgi:hypothetical protein